MPIVAELLAALAGKAPADKAASWDVNGLQVGDPNRQVDLVGVCHQVTDAVVDKAVASGIDLLVTYHPLIFKPLAALVAMRGPTGRAVRLLAADVAVATVHTAWDAARGGTADSLARSLGIEEVTGFAPIHNDRLIKLVTFVPLAHVEAVAAALGVAGGGSIGNYLDCTFRSEGIGTFRPGPGATPFSGSTGALSQEAEVRLEVVGSPGDEDAMVSALRSSHPYEEPAFDVYEVRSNFGHGGRVGRLPREQTLAELSSAVGSMLSSPIRMVGDPQRPVERVAVLPGAGGSLVGAALRTGADVFITGDVSHHQGWEALDWGMAVLDPGHAATERPGVAALLEMVSQLGDKTLDLTDDPTPWRLA